MTGKGKEEERKATFGSTLFTAAVVVVAAVAIFFGINSFRPHEDESGFKGLISKVDGKITVPRDADLKIDAILFRDFNRNEQNVLFEDSPGHKINAFAIRRRSGVDELDMLRTLSMDAVNLDELPEVPQEIEVRVSDRTGKGNVELFIITDRPYNGSPLPDKPGLPSDISRFTVQIGRKGLTGFVSVEAGGLYAKDAGSGVIGLGEGPVAALLAVRFQGDKPIGRSQLVLVKRKGMVHPEDAWFDDYKTGYFSLPFVGDNLETSRLAFMTPIIGHKPKVVVCTLDFKQRYDISALFPEGPISIDHWGMTPEEFNILYVREEFGEGNIEKVKVGMLDVSKIGENLAPQLSGILKDIAPKPEAAPVESKPADEEKGGEEDKGEDEKSDSGDGSTAEGDDTGEID